MQKRTYVTAAACALLLPTVVSAAMLAPKVAKVSSENPVPNRHARHTVDGSGLNANGEHLQGNGNVAWTSLGTMGAKDLDPYILYDLGMPMDVSGMHVWNYNSAYPVLNKDQGGELSTLNATMTILGPDKVELLTSVDGNDFKSHGIVRFEKAPGRSGYKGQRIRVRYKGVRYVKLDIKTTHEGTVFDGTGEKKGNYDGRALTGLSEIRFITPDVVEYKLEGEHVTVTEGGSGGGYGLRLTKRPAAGEVFHVNAVPSDRTLKLGNAPPGMATTASFTEENWKQWQMVKIQAVDDQVFTTDYTTAIRHFVARGSNPVFETCLSGEVSVRIIENDTDVIEDLKPIAPDQRMKWFRDIKYYWFICWGPCAVGGGEISFSRNNPFPRKQYDEEFPKEFKAEDFDAEEWVKLAKAGGLKTIVLIAKHCDGFCMWDSKSTTHDIMNTPFGRDMTRELADACRKHGLRFSLYYSMPDWYHPDWYAPGFGGPGYKLKPSEYGKDEYEFAPHANSNKSQLPKGQRPSFERYIEYMNVQVDELLSNYGDISLMWWDGPNQYMFGNSWTDKRASDLEKRARKLQPAMVQNNRVAAWKNGWWTNEFGDYDSSELGLQTFNNKEPWEYTFTLGTQWSWKPNDTYKSFEYMVPRLMQIAGRDGNCLMDVSPPESGQFEPHVVKRLTDIGNWLKIHGESYYGTRGGPYKPGSRGVSTRKGNRIYLHILNWPNETLVLPALGKKITKSWVMTGGETTVRQTENSVIIDVPIHYRKDTDTIVVLEIDGDAMDIAPIGTR